MGIQVKPNLVLSAIGQMVSMLDQKVALPRALEQNKYIWAKAMCKTKPLQDLVNGFANQVQKLVERELRFNKERVDSFMKVTRPPDTSVGDARAFVDQTVAIQIHGEGPQKQRTKMGLKDADGWQLSG